MGVEGGEKVAVENALNNALVMWGGPSKKLMSRQLIQGRNLRDCPTIADYGRP